MVHREVVHREVVHRGGAQRGGGESEACILLLLQEKMIDLETDLEEVNDSEQRWAAKHKRAIEQVRPRTTHTSEWVEEEVVVLLLDRGGGGGGGGVIFVVFLDGAATAEGDPGATSERTAGQ